MPNLPDGFSGPAPTTGLPVYSPPHSISVFEYPAIIHEFAKHIRKLQRTVAEEEQLRDARRDYLHATEWRTSGANDKERDSRFKLMLQDDATYQEHEAKVFSLTWHIKDEQDAYDRLVSESINARLRYRNNLVAAELFAGVPIDPKEQD